MNGFGGFVKRGMLDADRRIAAIFRSPPAGNVDRYLMSSAVVRTFDRLTVRLRTSVLHSQSGRVAVAAHQSWQRAGWAERYRTVGVALIVAVAVHLAATLISSGRPVWFRLIVPTLFAVFGMVVLIASRSPSTPK